MATTARGMEREPFIPRQVAGFKWSAVFAGLFVSLGVWALLYALGLAIGLTAINPQDPSSAKTAGVGTGIWSLIVPLIALFCGGLVTARVAGPIDRTNGAIHGAVLWGVSTVAGILVLGMLFSTLLSGIANIGGAGAKAAAQGGSAMGIDANALLGPVNQRLQAEGKPQVTAQQLQQAITSAASQGLRQGEFNRETFIGALSQNTNLSRQDAESIANDVQQQVSAAAPQVQTGALKAAETTGSVFWGIFGALLLGLVSAVIGATVGVARKQRVAASETVTARRPADVRA